MRLSALALMIWAGLVPAARAEEPVAIERRIIGYIKENLKPGQPLIVSKLYNEVFTAPEERQVLDKLNRAFFRIPLYIVEHKTGSGRLPSLQDIAGQFDLYGAEEASVVLAIMESDPRVPKFIRRDEGTGELVDIDMEKVQADRRFNQAVERTLTGWQGKPLPPIQIKAYDGSTLELASFKGKVVLLYVWFTNCPPCVRISPELVTLHTTLKDKGFSVVGANADKALGLTYEDSVRTEYAAKVGINFPMGHLSPEAREALGNVNIFPTLFLVNREGTIVKHYVNYQARETLEKDATDALAAAATPSVGR